MIKYYYACQNKNCNEYKKEFEQYQRISEAKLTTCNHCKEQKLERITKATNFSIKGIGVYSKNTH